MALLRSDDAADIDEISTSREAVADVLWFLKTTAEAKAGQPYERGALTLPDPDGKLASFFDRCEKVYTRDSSHLKSNQAEEGGQARGIDFYDGVHEGRIGDPSMLLPAGMRTVLAQALEIDGKKRLYVKMETESARWNPFHSKQDGAPASRPLEAGDRKNAMLHLLNLVKSKIGMSQGDDHSLANFREKVPGGVKSAYASLQSAAARSSKAKAFLKGAKEVNEMVVALDQVYGLEEGEIPLAFPDAAEAFFQTLLRALPKNTSQEIEDLYNGVGGEIVLNDRDLPPRPASAPPAAS